ncbi:hypothetical protein [Paraburkholderia pallida]|uniref:Uncharacterized protein n=1 Tax=Paraburkholderia pallida TaxID=2547399 RepID=A0A4P7D1I6_9BURK|nr:hypothetical protein [Paraburkholderia pallida]QBR02466.1 hypothetical protein E1956_35030 [Paraburkholderia pallida]
MTRMQRYKKFKQFYDKAKDVFGDLHRNDDRSVEMGNLYSFHAAPGGSNGGADERLVEVFFGNRAIAAVRTMASSGHPVRGLSTITLSETGASLEYTRTDAGGVLVTLSPARTETLKPREDFIVLGWPRNPDLLLSERVQRKHWRIFMSYMQCTSIDGTPTVVDRLRIGWIRFTRVMSVRKEMEARRVLVVSSKILGYVLTIGLSGFLLTVLTLWQARGQDAENQRQHDLLVSELAESHATVRLQNARLVALESRFDALQQQTLAKASALPRKR